MSVSEVISRIGASGDKRAVAELHAMFADAVFGLLVQGLPKAEPGQKIMVDGSGSVTMQYVSGPNGKKMIKACADPELFAVNYPRSFNVTMNGRELLEMAEKLPEAEGILICSAAAFVSFPIYKADYGRVRRGAAMGARRKWWEFWKRPS